MAKISDYKPADFVRLEFEDYAGEKTGEWIDVLRIDHPFVRKQMMDYNREVAEEETPPTDEQRGVAFIMALIEDWSFDEEISHETVSGLIELYPRTQTFPGIDSKILEAATNKSAFVKKKPTTDRVSGAELEAGEEATEVTSDHS